MLVVALPLCICVHRGLAGPAGDAAAAGAPAGRVHGRLRAARRGGQRLLPRRRAHPRGDRAAVDLHVRRSSSRSTRSPGSATTSSGRSTSCTGATRSRPSSSASRTPLFWGIWPAAGDLIYSAVAAVVDARGRLVRLPPARARDGGRALMAPERGPDPPARRLAQLPRRSTSATPTLKETLAAPAAGHLRRTAGWCATSTSTSRPARPWRSWARTARARARSSSCWPGSSRPRRARSRSAARSASMLELGAGFHPDFTGRENVFMNGAIHGLGERAVEERFDAIVEFAELERLHRHAGAHLLERHADAPGVRDRRARQPGRPAARRGARRRRRGVPAQVLRAHRRLPPRGRDARVRVPRPRAWWSASASGPCCSADGRVARRRTARRPCSPPTTGCWPTPAPAPRSPAACARATRPTRACGATARWRSWPRRLLGPDGPTDRFTAGEPMTIEMDLEAPEPVETPDLRHRDPVVRGGHPLRHQHRVSTPSPSSRIAGAHEHRASRSPSLPLHEGRFTVTLAVHSRDESVIYHWLDRWLEFSVFQQETGAGPVNLSGSWRLGAASPTPTA